MCRETVSRVALVAPGRKAGGKTEAGSESCSQSSSPRFSVFAPIPTHILSSHWVGLSHLWPGAPWTALAPASSPAPHRLPHPRPEGRSCPWLWGQPVTQNPGQDDDSCLG